MWCASGSLALPPGAALGGLTPSLTWSARSKGCRLISARARKQARMTASVIVDAGFLVALLSGRDANHGWAAAQAARLPPPWTTCEASVAEAFQLLGPAGAPGLRALLERRATTCAFHAGKELAPVLKLMARYAP